MESVCWLLWPPGIVSHPTSPPLQRPFSHHPGNNNYSSLLQWSLNQLYRIEFSAGTSKNIFWTWFKSFVGNSGGEVLNQPVNRMKNSDRKFRCFATCPTFSWFPLSLIYVFGCPKWETIALLSCLAFARKIVVFCGLEFLFASCMLIELFSSAKNTQNWGLKVRVSGGSGHPARSCE